MRNKECSKEKEDKEKRIFFFNQILNNISNHSIFSRKNKNWWKKKQAKKADKIIKRTETKDTLRKQAGRKEIDWKERYFREKEVTREDIDESPRGL